MYNCLQADNNFDKKTLSHPTVGQCGMVIYGELATTSARFTANRGHRILPDFLFARSSLPIPAPSLQLPPFFLCILLQTK